MFPVMCFSSKKAPGNHPVGRVIHLTASHPDSIFLSGDGSDGNPEGCRTVPIQKKAFSSAGTARLTAWTGGMGGGERRCLSRWRSAVLRRHYLDWHRCSEEGGTVLHPS